MTGNAINATSDELSSEELDAVSGGWFCFGCIAPMSQEQKGGDWGGGGNNDPAQMFQQILRQVAPG